MPESMPKARPLVSVGMPVYNSAAFVAETLRSILGQSFADFELIISDNDSDDGTSEICRDFARADSRIRYWRQVGNIGCPRNYNAVLMMARGTYFKWSSSNDICQPRFLEACISVLKASPDAVLAYPRTLFFNSARGDANEYEDGVSLDQDDPVERYRACDQRLVRNNAINGVIRTRELKSTTLHWDYKASDMALMSELSLYGKFIKIPELLFHRRMDPGSDSGSGSPELQGKYFPHDRSGSQMRGWRKLHQMLTGVNRAPLTWRNRLRLYDYLAHRAWWNRGDLGWFGPPKSQSI